MALPPTHGGSLSTNPWPEITRAGHGCRTLEADEVFLLGDTADSFDGRYWGPTRLQSISGVWTRF
ncbi:MAG: S26 family signal peptidase [Hyphomonadaceae bacterium]